MPRSHANFCNSGLTSFFGKRLLIHNLFITTPKSAQHPPLLFFFRPVHFFRTMRGAHTKIHVRGIIILLYLLNGRNKTSYHTEGIRQQHPGTVAVQSARGWRTVKDKASIKKDAIIAALKSGIDRSCVCFDSPSTGTRFLCRLGSRLAWPRVREDLLSAFYVVPLHPLPRD